jgi:hypothetical protein
MVLGLKQGADEFPPIFYNVFLLFPTCSFQVPNVFPIAPCFNPICFAKSPPLLIYIGEPKGEALIAKKKKVVLVRHPQLINMK